MASDSVSGSFLSVTARTSNQHHSAALLLLLEQRSSRACCFQVFEAWMYFAFHQVQARKVAVHVLQRFQNHHATKVGQLERTQVQKSAHEVIGLDLILHKETHQLEQVSQYLSGCFQIWVNLFCSGALRRRFYMSQSQRLKERRLRGQVHRWFQLVYAKAQKVYSSGLVTVQVTRHLLQNAFKSWLTHRIIIKNDMYPPLSARHTLILNKTLNICALMLVYSDMLPQKRIVWNSWLRLKLGSRNSKFRNCSSASHPKSDCSPIKTG